MPRWFTSSCFTTELEQSSINMAVLELSHCSLTNVPSEIFKTKEGKALEEVYLDANQLRDLPRALFGLQNLRILSLSDNELTIIPSAISNLVNLREVNISKNGIIDLPENIKNCKLLEEIDASVNPIGKIPESLSQLVSLTQLYLNDAFIDFLPASFGRLAKLRILELRDNHLRVLPKSMSHLSALERLDIGSNEFVEMPVVVGCLLNLKELWMDSNSIQELRPELGLLRQLLFFDISKNRLEWLPPEIESLQALTDLYASNNLLIELPEQIGCLGKLQTLKLDENHLGDLPNSMGRLQNLEELVLTCNELLDLPTSIGYLRKLRALNVDENFLESIPPELGSCTAMTILSLRDNRLVHIPEDIGRMPNVQVINLACNRLEYLPYTFHKLANLKALWLSENQSKPMVPLQSEYNTARGTHVLTCYMFPQEPLNDEENVPEADNVSLNSVEIHDEQENGNLAAVNLDVAQPPQRTSIVFDIDENDYLARLARFSSPYPKDVQDRAAQYLASRRQQQHIHPDTSQPPSSSRHQQREHRQSHPKTAETASHAEPSSSRHDPQIQNPQQQRAPALPSHPPPRGITGHEIPNIQVLPPAPPFVEEPVHERERELQRGALQQGVVDTRGGVPRDVRAEAARVEVPWYEDQASHESNESDHRGSLLNHREPKQFDQPNAAVIAPSRSTLNGYSASEAPLRTQAESAPMVNGRPPTYQQRSKAGKSAPAIPPPVYTGQSSSSYTSSLASQHSFREEAPSLSSSLRNPPTGEWVRHEQGSRPAGPRGSPVSYEDVHSFRSEEPSILHNNSSNQPVLRPPSYHAATGHGNTSEEMANHIYVDQLRSSTRRTIDTSPAEIDPRFSPPPGYSTIDPRVWSQTSTGYQQPPIRTGYNDASTSGSQTSGFITAGRQPVSLSQPETNRMPQSESHVAGYESRVREPERREGHRVIDSGQADREVYGSVPRPLDERDVRRAPLATGDDEEQFTVRIHKNPNLGFSVAGGKDSTSNPFDPEDTTCIYVTKVQPEGPASFALKAGDKLLEVNGISIRQVSHEYAVTFLKNNQVVNLLVSRKGEML